MTPELAAAIGALPEVPGIYVFRAADGVALYVGKANSLRQRVSSYLGRDLEPRLAAMVALATTLEVVATRSEAEALELENNWIKRHKPRYNVLLRDDKTYPYLKLTVQERWPRVAFTRRLRDDGAEYFGPFLPGGLARQALRLVQKLFGIRVCRLEIDGRLPRPCLYWDTKRCLGPCVDGLTSLESYAAAVERARLFLAGRTDQLLRDLRRQMAEAAEALEFERAAAWRDLANEVERLSQRSRLSSLEGDDVDAFGLEVRDGRAALVVLVMRGGRILDRRELFWEQPEAIEPSRLLSEVLPQLYDRSGFIPDELHLPVAIDGAEALGEWLGERSGRRVTLRWPVRGPKAARLALAHQNAEVAFRRRFRRPVGEDEGAQALMRHLDLAEPPRRIEGFDISTFHGHQTVAAVVVWADGKLRPGEYRSLNLTGGAVRDDFAAIEQAVSRRYRRRLEEAGVLPDLVLIDGGRGQLNAAFAALGALGAEETPLVALAKREEELHLLGTPEPLRLPASDPGLQLLERLRDEAHRFAVSRHRRQRSRAALHGSLDALPGIGPKRRSQLLRQFGSVAGVRAATATELVSLLGPVLGQRLHTQLRASDAEAVVPQGE